MLLLILFYLNIAKVVFWTSAAVLLHSYLLFPFILKILAKFKTKNNLCYSDINELPGISVILSVYNEEQVIESKIENLFQSDFSPHQLEVIAGSDASTDNTNAILASLVKKYPNLHFYSFSQRQGKPSVINQLVKYANHQILIFTDANIFFEPLTLFHLVKHFKNPDIGLVGGNIVVPHTEKKGISFQEKTFMTNEIKIKYDEGKIWGAMIGAHGACYAMRKEYFSPIPEGFAVDDFYITLKVLERKSRCILELAARYMEKMSDNSKDEFARKVRISAGNFQNLKIFKHLLWPPYRGLAFCFLSHKVLRWFGPLFLVLAFISNIFLLDGNNFYLCMFYFQCIFAIGIPLADHLLKKINIDIVILRFISHFYNMNLALLWGFFKFLKGVKTNVWQPTRRK